LDEGTHGLQDIKMDCNHPSLDSSILFFRDKWGIDLYRHHLPFVHHLSAIEHNKRPQYEQLPKDDGWDRVSPVDYCFVLPI
jgi:hypothetical protein